MNRFPLLLLLVLLTLAPGLASAVSLSDEFLNLEELYEKGELDELASALFTAKPANDEDRALQNYLSAMLKKTSTETQTLLTQASERFPNTHYGQLALLESAKIHLLERQPVQARTLLLKITSARIIERYYWLGVASEALDDHDAAISHCENYLRLAPNGVFLEEAYYLSVLVYQEQSKYQSAISTLKKLQALPGHPRNPQYFYLRLGQMYQLAGNHADALANYRIGFELNPNTQLAFEIEDHIFELKDRYGSAIDLTFLYPYSTLDLPQLTEQAVPDSLPRAVIDPSVPLRLDTKPSGGFFVQAGRFGVEANASQLSQTIRGLNLLANYFQDKANKSTPWVVVSGPYPSRTEADQARQKLISNSIDSFITRF